MASLTQAALARELGVTRQAIHKLVVAGVLVPDAEGRIDPARARNAIENNVHPGSKTAQALQVLPSAGLVQDQTQGDDQGPVAGEDEDGLPTNFHLARTLREAEEARMAKMRRETMEGTLIRKESVIRVAGTALASTREALLQLPARLTPLLTPETDPARVHAIIEDELHISLRQLYTLVDNLGKLKDQP